MGKKKHIGKIILKSVLWFIGIWALLLVTLQLTLSEKVLTKLVNKYAAEYVDGDLSFGSASVSMFKRFPRVFLTLEDFSVTYPADRFDAAERQGAQGHLVRHGCGETADTLASFKRFSASINVVSLMGGSVRIPHLRLVSPRIFAHSYADGEANWDMFRFGSTEDTAEDTTATSLPRISLGRISLSRHPHIVYTDSRDTVFAMIDVARIGFNGQIKTTKRLVPGRTNKFTPRNTKVGLTVDSLFVAGRVKADTVALALDRFYIQEDDGHMGIDAKARAMLATSTFGRVHLPIRMTGILNFPKDTVPAVTLTGFKADVGDFPIVADADLRFPEGRAGIKATVGIRDCRLNDVFHGFAKNIIPELEKVETDARLTMLAQCDGDYIYETGRFPKINATISLPEASIRHSDLEDLQVKVGIKASGNTDSRGRINASIDDIHLSTAGVLFGLKGGVNDVLGADPAISIDGNMNMVLDTLASVLPDSLGITATGSIAGAVSGTALLSQMSIYNFSKADIRGNISSDDIVFRMPEDTIDVNIKGLDITLAPENRTSRRDTTRSHRLMGITAQLESADVIYGEGLKLDASNVYISAKNSVSEGTQSDSTTRINPLSGRLKADRLMLKDASGTSLGLRETSNGFLVFPKKGQPQVPVLTLTSSNKRITLSSGKNRAILTDAGLKASAAMNTVERRQKAKAMVDSLARAYPDIPRDSLFSHLRSRRSSVPVPEWMKEEDFKKQDIDIRLDETMAKYFRDWDLKGQIGVRTGIVMTPHFPLKNLLRGFELNFTNNEVKVDSFKVVSGKSEIEAKGALTGLKGAMLGRRNSSMKLDFDISSDRMDAGELLAAYQKGLLYVPESTVNEDISDADLLKMVTVEDSLNISDSLTPSLIVVPANLRAEVRMNAHNVKYTDLVADTITAKIVMKERCVQITDTKAQTNMGAMGFNAFYSTRSKKDIKAGFDLTFNDITADKVISLMPAIDSIMPLLKSFSGLLDCEIAATTSLDTNMNLIMPSINGIMRISGEDLTIKENDMYRSLAKKLLLKNKKEGHIGDMKVEGVIQDNTVEIFPFIISIDRYMLALSGVQNLDMSYKYHASLIKSPFLIKLGVDVYGDDFDHMKFKIGKAKYKNENVPVFSSVIDQTKINLLESIRNIFDKGVDAAIRDNIRNSAILEHKKKIGYVRAVDVKIEELSADEQKQVEAEEAAAEAETETEATEEAATANKENNTENQQ